MTVGHTRRVVFTEWARDDLRSVMERFPVVAIKVVATLRQLEFGNVQVQQLRNFGKTGDLTDCGKIPVIVDGFPEHRIVVRDTGSGGFEVLDVVAVEERADDLVYLLTAVRLARLVQPVHRSDTERRIARILALRCSRPEGPRT